MRFKHSSILASSILLGAISSHVIAAEFKVPISYEIMYVDLKNSNKFGNDFDVNVKEGVHQIVIRYNQRMGHSSDIQRFKSEPIILDMNLAKDAKLELKAPFINSKERASDYAEKPTFTIVDANTGKKVDYKERMLPAKSGFQLTRDYLAEIKEFTGVTQSGRSNDVGTFAPVPPPKDVAATNEFQMMQFWYNKSDEATRKDFRIWMVDNSHQPKAKNTAFEMLTFWFNKANDKERKAFQVWLLQ